MIRIAMALLCVAAAAPGAAQEPVLLATQSDGQYSMDEGGSLTVRGIAGQISIRPGKDANLRFAAARPDDRKEAVPVALWERGTTLELAPATEASGPVLLEIVVPPSASVRVHADGSSVIVRSLERRVEIVGADLEFRLTGLRGSASLDVERGSGTLEAIAGEVTLRGEGVRAVAKSITGRLAVSLNGGNLEASALESGADLDVYEADVTVSQGRGNLKIEARNGAVVVRDYDGVAEIRADGATVSLERIKGDFGIETDGEVRFRGIEADVHVDGYGADVSGSNSAGIVEVKSDDGTVHLEDVKGAVRIQGSRVDARLLRIGGDILVRTRQSQIHVHGPSAAVDIEVEGGTVEVVNPTGKVAVTGDPDDVRITEANSPLSVEVDSDEVLVHWVSMAFEGESRIENGRGNVRAHLTGNSGACRVEAKSVSGTVDSSIPTIKVLDDGKSANGVVGAGSGKRPTVWLTAHGDVAGTSDPVNVPTDAD